MAGVGRGEDNAHHSSQLFAGKAEFFQMGPQLDSQKSPSRSTGGKRSLGAVGAPVSLEGLGHNQPQLGTEQERACSGAFSKNSNTHTA